MINAILGMAGAAGGIAQNIMNAKARNKMKRVQESKVMQMESANDKNRESLQASSPEAAYAKQQSELNAAQSSAESAALNTTANSAVSGSGDSGGAGIGAVKAAMAAHGATAGTAQAKSDAAGQLVSNQIGKGQAIDSNIMQGAQIGDMVNYSEQDNHQDIMGGIMGGLNAATNAATILGGKGATGTNNDSKAPEPPTTEEALGNDPNMAKTMAPAGNIVPNPMATMMAPNMGSMNFAPNIPRQEVDLSGPKTPWQGLIPLGQQAVTSAANAVASVPPAVAKTAASIPPAIGSAAKTVANTTSRGFNHILFGTPFEAPIEPSEAYKKKYGTGYRRKP